jgi:hypothetical protein
MLLAKDWLESGNQCFRQTGGSRCVVSSYAKLNGDLHAELLKVRCNELWSRNRRTAR